MLLGNNCISEYINVVLQLSKVVPLDYEMIVQRESWG